MPLKGKTLKELLKNLGDKSYRGASIGELGRRSTNIAKGALIGGLAVGAVKGAVDPLILNARIESSRRNLSQGAPNLAHEDKALVNNYFNVVRQFSPKAAANPLVAGALVNKMVQFGGVDHKLVQDLAKINKDTSSRSGGNLSGFIGAASGLEEA